MKKQDSLLKKQRPKRFLKRLADAFSENKDDSSKYLTVGKGSNLVVNAKLEPSTANVNTDIKYSIYSGNNKVASINSSTGEVTGGQAGVVTIRAQAMDKQLILI
mgnify:CR=1 FL=1